MIAALLAFIVFLILGVIETTNSNPQKYAENIKNEITPLHFTLKNVQCVENTKTANSLELVAKENNKSLFAFVGSMCGELEQSLKVGETISVSAIINRSEVLGIVKNGSTLLSVDTAIEQKVKNYTNYNLVYFALCLPFMFYIIALLRNR